MTAHVETLRALYRPDDAFRCRWSVRLPEVALTVFANDRAGFCPDGSVRGYVRETVVFVN